MLSDTAAGFNTRRVPPCGGLIDNRACAAYNAGQPLRVFACGAFRRQNLMRAGVDAARLED